MLPRCAEERRSVCRGLAGLSGLVKKGAAQLSEVEQHGAHAIVARVRLFLQRSWLQA